MSGKLFSGTKHKNGGSMKTVKELKTLEEHCTYVERFARISFFYASKYLSKRFPEKKLSELITAHTPIRYHGFNLSQEEWKTEPRCLRLLEDADTLSSLPPEEFEEEMWKRNSAFARERAELNYPNAVGVKAPPSWNCGSLKYDTPAEHPALSPRRIVFHIANSVGPYSIFEDSEYLARCFLLLLKETRLKYGSDDLFTGTWLNEHPSFLKYFPEEWRTNMAPRKEEKPVPEWHFGWWGQLVTGRGTINPKAEDFVRQNGCLRFACRSSHCSYDAMEKHLKENFLP